MTIFLATLTPMLTLFICIAAGYVAGKTKIIPDNAGKTLAKAETWIFVPALSFITMVRYCTVDTFTTHATNILLSSVGVAFAIGLSLLLTGFFAKKGSNEWGVYAYALAFANSGYMGDPVVLSLFGEEVLAYYKLFCLPITLLIYTWGVCVLTPKSAQSGSLFKNLLGAPTLSMLLGIAVGLSGLGNYLPSFLTGALDTLKACMGPVAMLLAGITIAKYDFVSMLKKKKVYVVTALRLTLLPAATVAVLLGVKTLARLCFGLSISADPLFLCFFSTAAAIGLNTVVFPEAYGGSPETGAAMTMVSHTLCVITIPLLYALMVLLFGAPFGA